VVALEEGIEDTMNLSDTMGVSPSTSSNSHLDSSMDQNLLPPTRQIHKVYTRKPRHENAEQLPVQYQHQLLVPVDGSPTTQTSGNLELPSGTLLSDLDLPICCAQRGSINCVGTREMCFNISPYLPLCVI
jgi:hypothetical protein